jgi:hypothetical protein
MYIHIHLYIHIHGVVTSLVQTRLSCRVNCANQNSEKTEQITEAAQSSTVFTGLGNEPGAADSCVTNTYFVQQPAHLH